jgi:hypothetical protein
MREEAFMITQTLLQERLNVFTKPDICQNSPVCLGFGAITAPQRSVRIPHLDSPVAAVREVAKAHLSPIKG